MKRSTKAKIVWVVLSIVVVVSTQVIKDSYVKSTILAGWVLLGVYMTTMHYEDTDTD